jgi:hypothetical protein
MVRAPPRAGEQRFHVTAEFRAPLDFVYRWCTDYRPDDARREKDHYERRILERSKTRVVYEDLGDHASGGWWWSRFSVDLRPPSRWHAESVGGYRTLSLDYALTALDAERTRLDLDWRRWPTTVGPARLSKRTVEKGTTQAWKNFAAALEKDYRSARRKRSG